MAAPLKPDDPVLKKFELCHSQSLSLAPSPSSMLPSTILAHEGVFVSVQRILPDRAGYELIDRVREVVRRELAPNVDAAEAEERFPRDEFLALGRAGLLSLPYSERYGGGGQPAQTYLQVYEEIASAWASVAVGVSVHALSCFPLMHFGTERQRERWLPGMLSGETLGAYALSEPHAGSDANALRTRAVVQPDGCYLIEGDKAWITHGGQADYYLTMARVPGAPGRQISCFLVPADAAGLSADRPVDKMGLTGQSTSTIHYDGVLLEADRRIGEEGQGLSIGLAALDDGRLGIAAISTGLAQAALDLAVAYARERVAFGKRIIEHEGLAFLLADMAAAVATSRATYLAAARRKDAGLPVTTEAAIAKLVASDAAMRVTTDAVQVLGAAGYMRDLPAERYMREAKVMQIFEGTNQIQRVVISRSLDRD